MNKNYERCNYCNRRKWLTSGCLRKWLKPMECKHLQHSVDNKRDIKSKDLINSILLPDSKPSSNRFVRFCKNKLFIAGSVRTLQRYFGTKTIGDETEFGLNKGCISSVSCEKGVNASHPEEIKRLSGYYHQHPTEACAIYCQLSKHGWYWGGITSSEAEELLKGQHDNVFLVRDSYDSRHLLCVSFRCVGRTLHARLLHSDGLFSLNNETFVPANRISEHCSSVGLEANILEMPIKLARPLNRFARLDSLQMICRLVIRKSVLPHLRDQLPLPANLIAYVMVGSDYIVP